MSVSARYRIGCALPSKKVDSFMQPSLLDHAKQNGVDLVPVDLSTPLIDQGPFRCIVHKLYGQDWKKELKEYASKSPNTVIIDPPECIERLHNRISMLEMVNRLKIPQESESRFGVPNQLVVEEPEGLKNGEWMGLKFPVIAKPILANGSGKSHEMCLVMNSRGLEKVRTPIVLQEFVKHGGVVFKVYVVGERVMCVKRRSLPDDISWREEEEEQEEQGILRFSQLSNCESDVDDKVKAAEMPSQGFVEALARGLREELGLNLFNFDLIRETKIESESDCNPSNNNSSNNYLVIDINYFPGYAKIPCFQQLLTDFFLKCCDHQPPQQQLQD
ncbi:hypothetical protein FNV43_RR23749 [Rhamnella rubrinervis]|uniref:Inositol-tetrakisphosphate 1-kinase n=1 Tax=Rhamnella rubrinervis TaxID=2594499 RepID=A0A8K0DK91_9ROSA|nr:hypothetical protein FNV43_RR23749 [Rhamnella rubrinervis]